MLDTVHTVETPEGVRLTLRAAGPVPRGLAFATDVFLRGLFYFLVLMGLAVSLPELAGALLLLTLFLGEWFYPVFFEVWNQGQTPGKRIVGLRVVNDDGTPVGWSTSLLRNLLMSADWIPGTYAAGLISMFCSRGFRRLGDLAAGTLVIHVEKPLTPPPGPAEASPSVAALAPPLPLGLEEQRAIVAFAERVSVFSEARADELAGLATPLHGDPGTPRERVLGTGAWLLGLDGEGTP